LIILTIFYSASWIYGHLNKTERLYVKEEKLEDARHEKFAKADLPSLLGDLQLVPSPVTGRYILAKEGVNINVETSIDTALQNYIINLLNRSRTYRAAVVVLRPESGRILAMADYRKDGDGETGNLCLYADLPAASLFKIISAAAVMEAKSFTPDTPLFFRGGKHTLYKRQLKQVKDRYTRKTNFRNAFSGSNNPVFGKIGIYDLGRELMTEYSDRFFFNHAIPFDLPLEMSSIDVPDDDFGLAEIASGFNKRTRMSPLHAALITSAVVNNGIMMEPWLVSNIKDESDRILYRVRLSGLSSPINEDTAGKLRTLMRDTVMYGTCRKTFRPLVRKKIFRDVELGAKTGTINDYLDKYKYDWLTAYALPKNGDKGICVTVLAIHGKILGIRAKDIAKNIINYRFTS